MVFRVLDTGVGFGDIEPQSLFKLGFYHSDVEEMVMPVQARSSRAASQKGRPAATAAIQPEPLPDIPSFVSAVGTTEPAHAKAERRDMIVEHQRSPSTANSNASKSATGGARLGAVRLRRNVSDASAVQPQTGLGIGLPLSKQVRSTCCSLNCVPQYYVPVFSVPLHDLGAAR